MPTNNAVLIQYATGEHKRLLSLTEHIHKQYCDRHGFDFWNDKEVVLDGRLPHWARVVLLKRAVEAGYEYIVWLDADCLIVDQSADLRKAIPSEGVGMTFHEMSQFNRPDLYDHWCTGAIYMTVPFDIQNSISALLREWWKRPDEGHGWVDQHALNQLFKSGDFYFQPYQLDRRWHSIVPHFEAPNPFVKAWHGYMDIAGRIEAMREEINRRNLNAPITVSTAVIGESLTDFQARSDRFQKAHDLDLAGDATGAELEYRAILAERPDEPEVLRELGALVGERGDLYEAERLLRLSIAYEPNFGGTWCLLGAILGSQGDPYAAMECYDRALHFSPDMPTAHFNRALCRLTLGDFAEGWHEWLWGRVSKHRRVRLPAETEWDGENYVHNLLVWTDQGAGDAMMFARFLPMVQQRAGNVVWEVHDGLVSLLSRQGLADTVLKLQLDGGVPVPYDAHIELADLPRVFGLNHPGYLTIKAPYITPDPARVPGWAEQVNGPGLKVGLVWAGNPKHKNDRNRSANLSDFEPILNVAGATFYAIQQGQRAEQTHSNMKRLDIRTWDDTAAIIENLDVLVTVDTGPAHLAGAMGQRVITLLPVYGDWRWGVDGEETHWYPSMTLLRQTRRGDWQTPVCQAVAMLEGLVEGLKNA